MAHYIENDAYRSLKASMLAIMANPDPCALTGDADYRITMALGDAGIWPEYTKEDDDALVETLLEVLEETD